MKISLILSGFLVAALAALVSAAPLPAVIPGPGIWQLDLELHGNPMPVEVTLPGDEKPTRFWYLLYTVTNNTGKDLTFYPQFDLLSNNLKLMSGNRGILKPIFEAVRNLYASTIPLLEPYSMVAGKLLQGQDNARDSLAIFPEFDPNATTVKIFFTGLSNEIVAINHPVDIDKTTNQPKKILLRKTLVLEYQVSGTPGQRAMLYRNRYWVMR